MKLMFAVFFVFVFLLNLLLFIGSLVAVLAVYRVQILPPLEFQTSSFIFHIFTNVLLFISIFLVLLSFLGCYGILTHNRFYLFSYVTIVIILMVVESIFVYLTTQETFKKQIDESLFQDALTSGTTNFEKAARSNFFNQTLVGFQKKYECCGINGTKDWIDMIKKIPGSCCGRPHTSTCTDNEVKTVKSCRIVFNEKFDKFREGMQTLICIALGIQIILVFCNCYVLDELEPTDNGRYFNVHVRDEPVNGEIRNPMWNDVWSDEY